MPTELEIGLERSLHAVRAWRIAQAKRVLEKEAALYAAVEILNVEDMARMHTRLLIAALDLIGEMDT